MDASLSVPGLASVAALYRHPVKGLTPEPLADCVLDAGAAFPGDRMYAVEIGPSGFDPDAPAHISKMRFAVLARIPELARVVSRWDETTGDLHLSAAGFEAIMVRLGDPADDRALEAWLTRVLGEEATAPLKVLDGQGHRFMDSPKGAVSLLNLASVRDLAERMGAPVDPLRFRANIWVEGWPAWIENDWVDREIALGETRLKVVKPIVRCVATHANPATGDLDMDVLSALRDHYDHLFCGIYLSVQAGGAVRIGDRAELI